ncbi:MAG: glycerol-3-phosphate acyltransferase [Planctomycetota bacterium]
MVWCVAGFAAGSIPFALLIGRTHGIDIREHGSGNVGATNLGRVLGGRYFALCFTLDLSKGLAPTLSYGLVGGLVPLPAERWIETASWLLVMVCPVLGHMFSPLVGFKGGKGVATGLGGLLGVFPLLTLPGLAAAALWGLGVKTTRYVGLSSSLAAASLPAWAAVFVWLLDRSWATDWPAVAVCAVLGALVCVKHRGNLGRTLAGTEPRVGETKASRSDAPSGNAAAKDV